MLVLSILFYCKPENTYQKPKKGPHYFVFEKWNNPADEKMGGKMLDLYPCVRKGVSLAHNSPLIGFVSLALMRQFSSTVLISPSIGPTPTPTGSLTLW